MPHSRRIIANTLVRTFTVGIAAGMRTQIPGALLTQALADGSLDRGRGPIWSALRRPAARPITLTLASGEIVGDKLPFTPNRIDGSAGIARLMSGAAFGALIASGLGGRSGGLVVAALSGAAGAAVGSYGGFWARRSIKEAYGLPDLPIALVEDVTAWSLARLAVAREL